MLVKDVATMHALTVESDAAIQELAIKMLECSVGMLVVVDGRVPMGIVTDRDIVTRVIARGLSPITTVAREAMTPQAASIRSDADLCEAEARMLSHRVRRLLVTDEQGRLAGVLSVDDLAVQHVDPIALSQIVGQGSPPIIETQPSFLS